MFAIIKSFNIVLLSFALAASYVAAAKNVLALYFPKSYLYRRFLLLVIKRLKEVVIRSSIVLTTGGSFLIKWSPDTTGSVSLDLRNGPAANIELVTGIANDIQNTGVRRFGDGTYIANFQSFLWPVPSSIPPGNEYTVQITFNG